MFDETLETVSDTFHANGHSSKPTIKVALKKKEICFGNPYIWFCTTNGPIWINMQQ
jgi:hypothetical protein